MSTYLQGVTDNGFNIIQYSPNLPLLTRALGKATERYDTNFDKLESGYSNIDDAAITNDGKRKQRTEYLNGIKDQIKNISTKDLGLQANINQAESLYAPFWEDKAMLTDIAYTKNFNTQYSKQKSYIGTDGGSQEALVVMEYNNMKIKTADPSDIGIYSKIPVIDAVEFKYTPKGFAEWLAKNKWDKIESEVPDGTGRIYKQINGDDSKHAFADLYKMYTGDAANGQYMIQGQYRYIQAELQIKENARKAGKPAPTEEEINNAMPRFLIGKILDTHEGQLKINKDAFDVYQGMFEVENRKTTPDNDKLDQYNEIIKGYSTQIKQITANINAFKNPDSKEFKDEEKYISSNPVNYLANLAGAEDMNESARTMAGMTSRLIKEDNAYLTLLGITNDNAITEQKNLFAMEQQRREAGYAWNLKFGSGIPGTPGTPGIPGTPNGTPSDDTPSDGAKITEVTPTVNPTLNAVNDGSSYDTYVEIVRNFNLSSEKNGNHLFTVGASPLFGSLFNSTDVDNLYSYFDPASMKNEAKRTMHNESLERINKILSKADIKTDGGPEMAINGMIKLYQEKIKPSLIAKDQTTAKGEEYDTDLDGRLNKEYIFSKKLHALVSQRNAVYTMNKSMDAFLRSTVLVNNNESNKFYKPFKYFDKKGPHVENIQHLTETYNKTKLIGETHWFKPNEKDKIVDMPRQALVDFMDGNVDHIKIVFEPRTFKENGKDVERTVANYMYELDGKHYDMTEVFNDHGVVLPYKSLISFRLGLKSINGKGIDYRVPSGSPIADKRKEINKLFMKSKYISPTNRSFIKDISKSQGVGISYNNSSKTSYARVIHQHVMDPSNFIMKGDSPFFLNMEDLSKDDANSLLTLLNQSNSMSEITLYSQGWGKHTDERAVGFQLDVEKMKTLSKSLEARINAQNGLVVLGIQEGADIPLFPVHFAIDNYDYTLGVNKIITSDDFDKSNGLQYTIKKLNNVTMINVGVQVHKMNPDGKSYSTSWVQYNNRLNPYVHGADGGWTEYPKNTPLSEVMSTFTEIMRQNEALNLQNLAPLFVYKKQQKIDEETKAKTTETNNARREKILKDNNNYNK